MAGLDPLLVLLIVSVVTGGILVAALLSRRNNRIANRLLVGAIACTIYIQVRTTFRAMENLDYHPFFALPAFPANVALLGCLYLYVVAMTEPGFRWTRQRWLMFAPALFVLIWTLVAPVEHFTCLTLSSIALGLTLAACVRQLARYQRIGRHHFSEVSVIRLNWLKSLLGLFFGLFLIAVYQVLLGPHQLPSRLFPPALTMVVLLMSFFSLRQSVLFADLELDTDEPHATTRHPRFNPEQLERLKGKLLDYLEVDKPYLNPELRLAELSVRLGLKPYEMSELINKSMGMNFYELVNHYRLAEVKRRLVDPAYRHLTILGIANDCGFNSKSVFNETFKKIVGVPPSVYRIRPDHESRTSGGARTDA